MTHPLQQRRFWRISASAVRAMQLEFVKAHDKITRRRKGRHGSKLGVLPKIWGFLSIFTQWLKLATSNLVHTLGLPRPTKNHTQRKSRRSLGLGKLPNIWGSPLIFLQRPRCPLSVSGASCYNHAMCAACTRWKIGKYS